MAIKKLDKPNEGIKCAVNSCEYYMNGDHCMAEKINVEPREAKESNETDCATFISRDKMF